MISVTNLKMQNAIKNITIPTKNIQFGLVIKFFIDNLLVILSKLLIKIITNNNDLKINK